MFTTFFSSFASAENAKLNNVIEEQKMYCKSAVLNGEFKGEKIVGFDLSKEDYFVVSEEATEECQSQSKKGASRGIKLVH